jgi:hypothetical protein
MVRLLSLARTAVGSIARRSRALARRLRPIVSPLRRVIRVGRGLIGDLAGLVPAVLAGAGVFLVVAGLFNYFGPAAEAGAPPSAQAGTPTPAVTFSLPPLATPGPSGSASASAPATWAVATRVAVPALSIDLPIVAPPKNEQFPLCDTAEYLTLDKAYAYPGAPQAVYLYAHARIYMFWQLLAQSKNNNGSGMIGMWVEVYTDDNQDHIYQITRVIRHVPANAAFADVAVAATTDELWLQTSEGHDNSSNKLQVVAVPLGVVATSYAAAHPAPRGKVCPDAPVCTKAGQGGCRKA